MNKYSNRILLSLVTAGLLSATAAHAAVSFEKAYVKSYSGRTDIPVPVSVVAPSITENYGESKVEVKFVVNEDGKISDIKVLKSVDSELASALTAAVSDWKFNPALKDGSPVARTVVLPFKFN